MRLVSFLEPGSNLDVWPRVGVDDGELVVDLRRARAALARREERAGHDGSDEVLGDLLSLLSAGQLGLDLAAALVDFARTEIGAPGAGGEEAGVTWRRSDLTLLAPIQRPPRLRDYMTYEGHIAGSGMKLPDVFYEFPVCYKGNPFSIVGPKTTIPWPSFTKKLDFEAELALIIGTGGRDLTVEQAAKAIAAVTIFNDVSARDVQFREMEMKLGPAKSKDFCNVLGPCALTIDEIVDEDAIPMRVVVNGEVWSDGNSGETRQFSFAEIVAWASRDEDLQPGEIMGIGTFKGGCGLELRRWIQPGDVVQIDVGGVGTLENTIGERQPDPGG